MILGTVTPPQTTSLHPTLFIIVKSSSETLRTIEVLYHPKNISSFKVKKAWKTILKFRSFSYCVHFVGWTTL